MFSPICKNTVCRFKLRTHSAVKWLKTLNGNTPFNLECTLTEIAHNRQIYVSEYVLGPLCNGLILSLLKRHQLHSLDPCININTNMY